MNNIVLRPGETVVGNVLYFLDGTRFAPSINILFKYGKDYKVCRDRVVFLRTKKLVLYLSNHTLMHDLLQTGNLELKHVNPAGVPHHSYWDLIIDALRSLYRDQVFPKLKPPPEIVVSIDDHLSCILSTC